MSKIEVDGEEWIKVSLENAALRERVTELQRDMTNQQERHRLEKVGGILSGKAIEAAVQRGDIEITPFKKEHLNPASIDLTLGRMVREYVLPDATLGGLVASSPFERDHVFDSKCELKTKEYRSEVFVLEPRKLYLMHTQEVVHTKYFVPVLDGKSSIGRLGVSVHITAGYGDPGFNGQYTLEVTTVYPIRVYAGMRFAQMRFHTLAGERVDYQERGSYVGESALGPVPSKAWRQFK